MNDIAKLNLEAQRLGNRSDPLTPTVMTPGVTPST